MHRPDLQVHTHKMSRSKGYDSHNFNTYFTKSTPFLPNSTIGYLFSLAYFLPMCFNMLTIIRREELLSYTIKFHPKQHNSNKKLQTFKKNCVLCRKGNLSAHKTAPGTNGIKATGIRKSIFPRRTAVWQSNWLSKSTYLYCWRT